jgi:hypothetical protein
MLKNTKKKKKKEYNTSTHGHGDTTPEKQNKVLIFSIFFSSTFDHFS